jgi:hypothetical protein
MSVPDTRTAFNCRCSFNWKRRTDGNCELSNITSAIDTLELLGSRPGRCIPGDRGQYIVTTRLCGPQSQSGSFGEDRKHAPLPEFEPFDRPAQSLVRRRTAPVFYKISQVEKISNLVTNGCCDHSCSLCTLPCQFWELYILFRHARMSVRSQLQTECQKEINNKLNIRNKSIIDSDSKALIIDVRSGWGVNFLNNTVNATKNTRRR